MSFAEPWTKYLEDHKHMIIYIRLIGNRDEDTPQTHIETKGDYVEQTLLGGSALIKLGGRLPDRIMIDPTKVNTVDIVTSGPYKFTIRKNRAITMIHSDETTDEQKNVFRQAAEKLSYQKMKFEERDIID